MKIHNFSHTLADGWSDCPNFEEWDSPNTLVLAFCSVEYMDNSQVLKELTSWFPNSTLTGCSTSGEIHGGQIFDHSIQISVIKFDSVEIKIEYGEIFTANDSAKVGEELSRKLSAHANLKGALILSDGLCANGSALIKGFNKNIDPKQTSVSGGLAGDQDKFERTWVIKDGSASPNTVAAIGLFGENLQIATATQGGWDIFGPERTITKSSGNILYEIDDRPALDLYKEYLGDKANELPASGLLFPLQIRSDSTDEHKLVRTILSVSEEEKSVVFAGDLPEGYQAQLMRANFERVIDGAGRAGELILDSLDSANSLSSNSVNIAISCVGRRLVLGMRAEEEVEALQEAVGANSNVIGFYSYGELAPHLTGTPCDLHNQSMTVMTVIEKSSDSSEAA